MSLILNTKSKYIFFISGDQYNISAMGSSISYPNSPVNEYLETDLHNGHDQGELSGHVTPASIMGGDMVNTCPAGHFLSNSATLGRMPSARFGSRKSPFQVCIFISNFYNSKFYLLVIKTEFY